MSFFLALRNAEVGCYVDVLRGFIFWRRRLKLLLRQLQPLNHIFLTYVRCLWGPISGCSTNFFSPFHMLIATMYELRAGLTAYRKKDLLVEVAKWSGDGLRPTCLKMSS